MIENLLLVLLESRLYVTKSAAHKICPQAFGSPSNESEQANCKKEYDISFLDAGLNPLSMVFQRRDDKCYLTGPGWRDFVKEKKGDHIIAIHEYKCKSGTGERFFMSGSKLLFQRLIG
jgi:hypothetical protein